MSSALSLPLTSAPAASRPVSAAGTASSSVFLPKEHGSWSLALEPVALGLLLAPSLGGGALALAAIAGFFSRRPLRGSFTLPFSARRIEMREALLLWSVLALTGLFEAGVLGGWSALWPLLPAAGFGAVFASYELRGQSRALPAELGGCLAFAFLPAALATLNSWSTSSALALALLAFARSGPAVLVVRQQLRRAKGQGDGGSWALLAAVACTVAIVVAAALGWVPLDAVGGAVLLLVRTLWYCSPWRPRWSSRQFGIFETALGVVYLLTLGLAYRS